MKQATLDTGVGGMCIERLAGLLVAALVAVALFAIFVLAPTESSMGPAQRIVYVHVSVAWVGLLGTVGMAACGMAYLAGAARASDDWLQAFAENGWLASTLTLVTGSLWASEAWNTWWTWEPRLTTMFVLWLVYTAFLLLRRLVWGSDARAWFGAVVGVMSVLDVPFVVMAPRWFRGMHPVAPTMDPVMRVALFLGVCSFTALFVLLLVARRVQLGLERRAIDLGPQLAARGSRTPRKHGEVSWAH